jgi:riboflavin biosynthesis pyrimidine reductase
VKLASTYPNTPLLLCHWGSVDAPDFTPFNRDPLQNSKVSYIFAGKEDLDFKVALEQLYELFGIKTLMLEGGGRINGSLLNAGLIDELSLLVLPLADGTAGTPTAFEVGNYLPKEPARELKLIDVQKLQHDVLWLRYKLNSE